MTTYLKVQRNGLAFRQLVGPYGCGGKPGEAWIVRSELFGLCHADLRREIFRGDVDGLLKARLRRRELAQFEQRLPEPKMRAHLLGVERQGPGIGRAGFVVGSELTQDVAEQDVGLGLVGRQFERAAHPRQGVLWLVLAMQGARQTKGGNGVVRFEFQSAAISKRSLLELLLGQERIGQVVVGVGKAGMSL